MPGIISALIGSGGGSSLVARKLLDKDLAHYRDIFAQQPHIKRELQHFVDNAGKIGTTEALAKNKRIFTVILTAFGLEDKVDQRAFMQQMLDGGLKEGSLASKMVDPRFKEMVRFMEVDDRGLENLKNPVWLAQLAAKYISATFEQEVGEASESVRLGMYFERKASGITNWYQVLGDRALSEVARKALGMPAETAKIDVDKQVEILKKKMDIADFQDPAKVSKFVEKYLARADAESGAALANNPTLMLLNAAPLTGYTPVTFDSSLLLMLNKA